jgi:hypothetical protein
MPGLTGIVGSRAGISRVRAATSALRHLDGYRSRELEIGARAALGQVWRGRDRGEEDWAIAQGVGSVGAVGVVGLMLNGTAFSAGPHARRVQARAILDEYLRTGVLDPLAYDGAFVMALADGRRGTVTIWNDRVGTLPVYYMESDGAVAFAPEAKALFAALGHEPKLSRVGIVSFLSCGYCLGKTTLFDGVHCLEPGSALEISIDAARCSVRRYWKAVYAPSRALRRRRDAEAALHDAARAAHELVTSDSVHGHDLLLSGGWDSRGVLAFLDSIGRLPSAAIAWGRTKEIPDSDPYLAERLAERFALPFKFIGYDSDQLLENAHDWCRLSELANDNTGWFAEGATLLATGYSTNSDFTLVGDEAWGWHGLPRSEHDARAANLPASIAPEVAACLASAARDECAASYEAEIDRVLEPCANEHPIDRRDFLYLHGRVARFIFALGYYKELSAEMRRPFLLAGVLDVMQHVPRRFRIDKNLYISTLARYFPELAAFPLRRARSLPEWSRDIRTRPALRRFFLDLLDERRLDGELGAVLDAEALGRLKAAFFNTPVSAKASSAATPSPRAAARRSLGRERTLRLKQRIHAAGLHPASRSMEGAYPSRGQADVVRCVAFLSLLQGILCAPSPSRAQRALARG